MPSFGVTLLAAVATGNVAYSGRGPPQMMTALAKGFRALGIPASRVRWEQFGIR